MRINFDIAEAEDYLRQVAVLRAAKNLGLFDHFRNGAIARSAISGELNAETITQLLDSLAALGVLELDADEYRIAAPWKDRICGSQHAAFFSRIAGAVERYERWQTIPDLATGKSVTNFEDAMFSTGDSLIEYLSFVREENRDHSLWLSSVLAEKFAKRHGVRFLDLAGGHGLYAFDLLRSAPDVEATILDLEKTVHAYHEMNRDEPLLERITVRIGDINRDDAIGEKYDLILVNDLLHSFDRADKLLVLGRVRRALKAGGMMVVSKFFYEDPTAAPDLALFSMRLHVNSSGGYLERNSEMATLLGEAGFTIDEQHHVGEKISYFASA